MSRLHQFLFKQYFKIHVFCLLMIVTFRFLMDVHVGLFMWLVVVTSVCSVLIGITTKPFFLSKDVYAIVAVSACFSLTLVSWRFLWVALAIDLRNMMHFLVVMLIFALVTFIISKKLPHRKRKSWRSKRLIRRLKYIGWSLLVFLFFYQVVLSYLLRPNFLTVLSLSVSHVNLLVIIWTYFDLRKLYRLQRLR